MEDQFPQIKVCLYDLQRLTEYEVEIHYGDGLRWFCLPRAQAEDLCKKLTAYLESTKP